MGEGVGISKSGDVSDTDHTLNKRDQYRISSDTFLTKTVTVASMSHWTPELLGFVNGPFQFSNATIRNGDLGTSIQSDRPSTGSLQRTVAPGWICEGPSGSEADAGTTAWQSTRATH